ncbi:hypothetical protein [Patulibacter sp. SYSU D01012]|uniref:hypothetical protein n=1 Tax=Patulibacter sp. SYSU D01012 TaxID=2817381 RepID=UPI001B301B79|nr:hypothetical protein [Patulibacter sp. SYSU D01012]
MTSIRTPLGRELLGHLDEQLRSIERLARAVEALGTAVRVRDAPSVLRHTGTIEAETTFRVALEERRTALLVRGGQLLGMEPWAVTVTDLCTLLSPEEAEAVTGRSVQLVGATEAVAREHEANRMLLYQELTFVEHLLRLGGAPPRDVTYEPPPGVRPQPNAVPMSVLDLRA